MNNWFQDYLYRLDCLSFTWEKKKKDRIYLIYLVGNLKIKI